jgi:hypothetical protein
MKINKKQLVSALILSFMFLTIFSVVKVQAQTSGGAWDSQVGMEEVGEQYGQNSQHPTSLVSIIVKIINYSMGILGVLFLGLIVMSGFQWMTAGGNEDSIEKAKSRMKNAIIGLVIVLMSWTISYFIMYKLVLPATNPQEHFDVQYDTDPNTF